MIHLPKHRRARNGRGQSLVEFALVVPIFILIIGGIIQFGIIFWAQNTLTQVARDTGRWAATQANCSTATPVVDKANEIANGSSLVGKAGPWPAGAVTVSWKDGSNAPTTTCPTKQNEVVFVSIGIEHQVPIFFPWMPGNGTLSTKTEFRMEPST